MFCMVIKLGIHMYASGYVVQIRLRLRHLFLYVGVSHICECIHTYLCNKHTENGSQYVTWRKFLVRYKSLPYAIEKVEFALACANALVYVHMDPCLIYMYHWILIFVWIWISAQPRPMTNGIWQSLGLHLVNIDVDATVHHNIPLALRDRAIFTFSVFEARQSLDRW